MRLFSLLVSCLALLVAIASAPVCAASLSLAPVKLQLNEKTPSARIDVANRGAEPVVVQVDLQAWEQNGNDDEYKPTADMVFNPPLFRLEPGQSQVVRVGFRKVPDTQQELAYRVFITEIAKQVADAPGLQVNVRMGVPIFYQRGAAAPTVSNIGASAASGASIGLPAAVNPGALSWSVHPLDNGRTELRLRNDASRHVRISTIQLVDATSGREVGKIGNSYCLAGGERRWQFERGDRPSQRWTVRADIDGQALSTEVSSHSR